MSKPFKLSTALYGHSLDVRSVAVSSTNAIVSGSRDKTAKLWIPNEFDVGFSETMSYKDQKNFVASVLYLERTKDFPNGLVITAGNDCTILVYKPHEPFATFDLHGHSNPVCCLSKGLESNSVLSSSWDSTAKLWFLGKPTPLQTTFAGHTAAIWSAIQLQNSNVVTASADKTIGIYTKEGVRINIIQGHTDCVRGLIDFPELNYFMSCSNDATIKVWTYNGSNTDTYYGHTNYIYSIARNTAGGDNCFVTSGEDRTVRYWKDGINTETINLPAQSVWSVACLSNGDIVTGTSDAVVRIFTQDETRFASIEALNTYEEAINALNKQATQEIGGYKVSDLPGKEALYEPGKRPGQMKMIREPQGVVAYTWVDEGDNSHWEKVGDVLGGADPNADNKTSFEGKAYDFVFSVEAEPGKPPLKLPYNKGDDPYVAAHNFLEKHMLPAAYLETVVSYILQNSADANETVNPEYVDPFTGASSYRPSSSTTTTGNAGINVDPFTGSSSYFSANNADSICEPLKKYEYRFFPLREYRSFETGDPKVILGKLKEFNQQAESAAVEESCLERVIKLCTGPVSDDECFKILFNLLNWNDEIVFPVLDVIRMAVRYETNNQKIIQYKNGYLFEKLKYYTSPDCTVPNSTLVAFRILCNLFTHPAGEQLIFANRVSLLENITSLSVGNKNIQIALATLLLNMTLLCIMQRDEFGILLLANVMPDIIFRLNDAEAQFRGLMAIGTLLSASGVEHTKMARIRIQENVDFLCKLAAMASECSTDAELKKKICASEVLREIRSYNH